LDSVQFTDIAAGVPFLAVPPAHERPNAPVVVAWHLMDPPSTETALAATLPLDGLDTWRIYLGLPETGARSPGAEESMRRGYEDAVVNMFGPISHQAAAEFAAAYDALRARFGFEGPLAVVGGSLGAAVAQLVAIERADVVAMAIVSPVARLRTIVAANERRFGVTYAWHPAAEQIADRLDFVARADETARHAPAVQIIVGGQDDEGIRVSAADLRDALAKRYTDPSRVELVTVADMPHALAEGPDETPSSHAAEVDRLMVDWLGRQLP
jgi:pimeloyl-ACP methyl ester carboxylesterase